MPAPLQVRPLTEEERAQLERLARSRTAATRAVERAQIIWASSRGDDCPTLGRVRAHRTDLDQALQYGAQSLEVRFSEACFACLDTVFNAAAKDFHLGAGSPAIGAGVVMPGLWYNGSAPDLGALQSGINGPLPAPSKLRLVGN